MTCRRQPGKPTSVPHHTQIRVTTESYDGSRLRCSAPSPNGDPDGTEGHHEGSLRLIQIVDVVTAFKPLTKLSRQIVSTSGDSDLIYAVCTASPMEDGRVRSAGCQKDVTGEELAGDIAMVQQRRSGDSGRAPRRARPCRRVDPQSKLAIDPSRRCHDRIRATDEINQVRAPHQNSYFTTRWAREPFLAAAIYAWADRAQRRDYVHGRLTAPT